MHRSVRVVTRSFSTSRCWCESSSSATPYSLPHDAFSSKSPSTSSSTAAAAYSRSRSPLASVPSTNPRQRQKQFLTDSEAQAFADLLGEILPKSVATSSSSSSKGSDSGVFDLFNPPNSTHSSTRKGTANLGQDSGISKIQSALHKKMMAKGARPGSTRERLAATSQRTELSPQEELELDRLKEEMSNLSDDRQVYEWGLERVFGFDRSNNTGASLFVDPNTMSNDPRATSGPASRLYPELLLHLFLTLRDVHHAPHTALSVFQLASSNAFSYIHGCTSQLYYEVLATKWAIGQGDVESVLNGLEEMQSGGVRADDRIKDLVKAIGESIRIDRERTELRVQVLEDEGKFGGRLDEAEREREIVRTRWYGDKQIKSWSKMETMLEDTQDEQERMRRERKEEQWRLEDRERERIARDEHATTRQDSYDTLPVRSFEKPSLYSHRSDPRHDELNARSSKYTHAHDPNRRAGLSPLENVPLSTRPSNRTNHANDSNEEERNADGENDSMLFWKQK
ncbi:uncharacterized protein JCM15063_006189 [Sporobolomyces koalae]|uniref:uncharacterized protein n=1 Tax=Sporobolomyces koalae TaxID=500713 RepID=UPI00316D0167